MRSSASSPPALPEAAPRDHLLFAATLVGSLVMSWIVIVAMRTAGTPDAASSFHRVAVVATGATITGLAGVITFGLWLAVLRTDFHPWDGWVIAAIVLWVVATVALFNRTSNALVLRAVRSEGGSTWTRS